METGDQTIARGASDLCAVRLGAILGTWSRFPHANATRDPRGWSVTTLYFALVAPHEQVNDTEHQMWVSIDDPKTRALAFDPQRAAAGSSYSTSQQVGVFAAARVFAAR